MGDGKLVLWEAEDMWTRHTTLVTYGVRLGVLTERIRPNATVYGWEGAAADAARAAVSTVADALSDAVSCLGRIAEVLARAGDDRAALDRWDPDDRTGALYELDRTVAEDLTRTSEDPSDRPRDVGPTAALDVANRRRLSAMRLELLDAERALSADVDNAVFGGVFTDADAGLAETRARLASIDAIDAVLALPGRRLVHLEAGPRRTLAAVSVGDVDRATRLAVFLPGADTTVEGSLSRHDDEAAAVIAEAGELAPDSVTAGIVWLGYEAPQWNWDLIDPERSVVSTTTAAAGAADLTKALDALHGPRRGGEEPVVTVVAHSYGTVLAEEALRRDAPADAVVLMGSPGFDASASLPVYVAEAQLYVAEARWDPVADLGWFGPDPSELAEASLLSTDGTTGHSNYLEPGSTGARSVAAVVAGVPGAPEPRRVDVADIARFLVGLL